MVVTAGSGLMEITMLVVVVAIQLEPEVVV
jgi:hypothetical protein